MTPPGNEGPPGEDRLADLLAAYDPTTADNTPSTWDELDPASRRRLEADRHIVDQLNRLSLPPSPSLPLPPSGLPFTFGRFRVRRKLGAGGCGVVFLADDPVLGRTIALKVPRPHVLVSQDLQSRFLREAQAAAILSHPNIVPVYEAGTVGWVCYTAAEYCPGPTLARWLEGAERPVPAREAAALVGALATGIGYAHRRGVIHRDLKPSNILLAPHGSAAGPAGPSPPLSGLAPRITDFGFAKLIERDEAATQMGAVVGTPLYMAPEQAEGRAAAIGPPTDVYALGVILYELLAGRPPLTGTSTPDTLRRIVVEHPQSLRSLRPGVPRDLEAICRKCLEKDPRRRYADGDALATDLGRFLSGQPTLARPLRWTEQFGMWGRRHPTITALVALVVTSLLLLATLGWMYQRDLTVNNAALMASLDRERSLAADAYRQREIALDQYLTLRRHAYLADVRQAAVLAERGALTDHSLKPWDPDHGEDLRGFEWRYLTRLGKATRTWAGHQAPVSLGPITSDGRWAVTVAGQEVRLWDVARGRVVAEWLHTSDLSGPAAVSPDGRLVAVVPEVAKDGLLLFTLGRPEPRTIRRAPAMAPHQVDFANDRLLVAHGAVLDVYDTLDGARLQTISVDGLKCAHIAVSPDGSTVAAGFWPPGTDNGPSSLVLHNVSSGQGVARWTVPDRPNEIAFAADGRHLLLNVRARRQVQVWDVVERRARRHFRFPTNEPGKVVDRLADGRLAAATWPAQGGASREVSLAVWDPRTDQWAVDQVVPPCVANLVRFRPDGRGLLVGGMDSTVHMMELVRPAAEVSWPVTGECEAWAVAVSPDGRRVVTGGDDHAVRLWDSQTRVCLADRADHRSLVTTAAFAPTGAWFATGSFDGKVIVHDPRSAAPRQVLTHGFKVRSLAVSPDGRAVAAAGEKGVVSVWEVESGKLLYRVGGAGSVAHAIAFTADGKALLAAPEEDDLVWLHGTTGERVRGIHLRLRPSCLAASPNGQTIAVGYETGQIAFLDAATGQERFRVCGSYSRLNSLAFSPDGKTLAAGAVDGSVRLWHAGTGTELFAIARGGPQINGLTFAPDGSFLAAARHDGRLSLWPAGD